MEGVHEHVLLLVNVPPKTTLAKVVNSLKGAATFAGFTPALRRRDLKRVVATLLLAVAVRRSA
jgi:REP element-mobilizing transposase RayT